MTRLLCGAMIALSVACGRTVTAPERACGWVTTTSPVRNSAGDSVATATLRTYTCPK